MTILTEYRTAPGRRGELFEAFRRLLANRETAGQDVIVWSTSTTERDASFLFEYWSEAENFADHALTAWYAEFMTKVDELVTAPPVTKVTVPLFAEGV